MSPVRFEFAAVCRSCEVPTRGQLTVLDDRVTGVIGGRLDESGWTCDGCLGSGAIAAIVAGGAK